MSIKQKYDQAVGSTTANNKTVREHFHSNEVTEDLILSVDDKSTSGKIAFCLIKNCKTEEYLQENCHWAWKQLISMCQDLHHFFGSWKAIWKFKTWECNGWSRSLYHRTLRCP